MVPTSREIWMLLLHSEQELTVGDISRQYATTYKSIHRLTKELARIGYVEQLPRAPGRHRIAYMVTGTCRVPSGIRVAEVQV